MSEMKIPARGEITACLSGDGQIFLSQGDDSLADPNIIAMSAHDARIVISWLKELAERLDKDQR